MLGITRYICFSVRYPYNLHLPILVGPLQCQARVASFQPVYDYRIPAGIEIIVDAFVSSWIEWQDIWNSAAKPANNKLHALFQISCHSSKQNLEVQGLNSDAGNFMLVTGKQRAALAAVSALSLREMLTCLGIQQNSITLPAFMKLV